jgi:histone acetyltransferase MYST1
MFARKCELKRYQATIPVSARHPPGNEIYRHAGLAMFEIDGYEEKIYCQNLCYIAKLFLDHKTLYFDVDPFLFYVLCEVDTRGYHIVGYFSKEKYSDVGYNLACILSFPAHQRKGYGRFLISFSYELSKKEEKVGSPEKPMSDLGQQAYKPYWASTIIDFLLYRSTESTLSIMDIAKRTSIMADDIIFTLNQLGILKILNGVYFIAAEKSLLQKLALKYPIKEPRVDASKIHWTPFIVADIKRDKFSIHSKKSSIDE